LSENHPASLYDTLAAVRGTLAQIARWGVLGFNCSPKSLEVLARWFEPPTKAGSDSLDHIQADLGDCRRCALWCERTHIVFGEGDPGARLLFLGEGPGVEEDRSGRPFVGAAGELLERIIQAMKMTRAQVYICNIVKCRPPGNRNPEEEEIAACRPFLERQLNVLRPDVICALGNVAARSLLGTTAPISRLRGRFHDYHGIKVMPTFHPAYLLRNPDDKRLVWEDMKKIMAILGLSL
jgi:uracil-DNA glycosylase